MSDSRQFRLDDLLIDLDRQRVERAGEALEVSGLSFRLLEFLLLQGIRVIEFDELIAGVWAPAVVGEETVTQRVKLLRRALGDDGRSPRYLRSVRGIGYQLCSLPVAMEFAGSSDTGSPPPEPTRRWRKALQAVTALAIVAVAGGLAWHAARKPDPELQAGPVIMSENALQRARYYAGIGQDANNERAIALYEEVLASEPANTEAMAELSRALAARMCLYNRGTDSAKRAEAVARTVVDQDASDSVGHHALAYALDCQGLIDQALLEYERAYALDPASRNDSLASAAFLYAEKGRLADALGANLKVSADRANLRFLDIQVARVLELLGFKAAAEQRYERSFRLYPDNVYSNADWPRSLFLQGRLGEAEAAVAEALERPLHPDLLILAGQLALLRGEQSAALAAFEKASSLRPHLSWPETLLHVYSEGPRDTVWLETQLQQIRKGIEAGDRAPVVQMEVAVLELSLGHRERALDALDSAIEAGFVDQAYLQVSPFFIELAGEPRFVAALDAIGRHVARERATVLAADWLPADLLSASRQP
ncbi:winged helix-turn-helix domain-containing protein [Dokdonella sp.]|uniref:winged helix-turn-helix domain-containing protein n=1 Tax=Dokdonella sp. TaxID=2291710 RepID=UPI003C318225